MESIKRVFFGFEVKASWPGELPSGRILDPAHRHMTLAFLGNVDISGLLSNLENFPPPPFAVGLTGIFDECLFLPFRHPHVVAWRVKWQENELALQGYQEILSAWLQTQGFKLDERKFLSHVTLCREPFKVKEWEKAFHPLPMFIESLHLYESLGNLRYEPLWSYPLLPPFKEIEHTADIAFEITGDSFSQLFQHALMALSFKSLHFLPYAEKEYSFQNIDDIIIQLNELVSEVDARFGCLFKAVSFHGDIQEEKGLLKWEMIVDV